MAQHSAKRRLTGDDGYDPDQVFVVESLPAERVTLAAGAAGKPSIVVLSNGDILVSYIRNYHLSRYPEGECMEVRRSSDGGATWADPVRATRSPHNDREGYLVRFDDDGLLLCYMRVMGRKDPAHPWQGPYLCESTDGGRTWSEPWQVDISAFCPAGPFGAGGRGHVVLPDGRLLLFVSIYEIPQHPFEVVMVSHDRGRTFPEYHHVSGISGDSSFTRCASGEIAGALRVNAPDFPRRGAHPELAGRGEATNFMAFSRSSDEGKTWSAPEPLTGENEIPAHMMQLRDRRLLLTFGVRHYPLGIQAMFSRADARTWERGRRMTLACNGAMIQVRGGHCRHAIGHPYTVELPDGRLFTAYYRLADPFDPASCQVEGVFWSVP